MKKNRIDSISEELRVISFGPVKCPSHLKLRKIDKPHWNAIIAARAITTWNDLDLTHAVSLARTFADLEVLASVTPKDHRLIEALVKQSLRLSKMLHLHAGATSRVADTRRRTQREKALLDAFPDESLLAKPVTQ
jgi:UDP-N-acetylglucosamine transferase subunit ALG13